MSCCSSCGCTPCNCDNPVQPDVESLNGLNPVIQVGGDPVECTSEVFCDQNLIWESVDGVLILQDRFYSPAGAASYAVCDQNHYPVGTCVGIRGSIITSSNNNTDITGCMRVTAHTAAGTISLDQFANIYDGVEIGAKYMNNIQIAPLGFCPLELSAPTPADEICHNFYIEVETTFTVLAAPASLSVDQCNDLQVNDVIELGSEGCFEITAVADNGKTLTVQPTANNTTTTPNNQVVAGSKVTLVKDCEAEEVEEYVPPQWSQTAGFHPFYDEVGTRVTDSFGNFRTVTGSLPAAGAVRTSSTRNRFITGFVHNECNVEDHFRLRLEILVGGTSTVNTRYYLQARSSDTFMPFCFPIPAGYDFQWMVDDDGNGSCGLADTTAQIWRYGGYYLTEV